jgi:hypothetical protein
MTSYDYDMRRLGKAPCSLRLIEYCVIWGGNIDWEKIDMSVEKGEKTAYTIGAIIASVLLFWAIERHPYGYYTLLRWITCAVCVYGAVISYKLETQYLSWLLGIIAFLFNPILPIHLDRSTWKPIDILAGIIIPISAIIIWFRKIKNIDDGKDDEL